MWTDFEILKLGELYSKLSDEKLEDFFPSFIIDAIKAEEGKAYVNLRLFYTLPVMTHHFYTCVKKCKEIISLYQNIKPTEKLFALLD